MTNLKKLPPIPSVPTPRSKWKHFKGTEYKVVRVARDCEDTNLFFVVYEDSQKNTWIREVSDFLGFGPYGVKRFTPCA